MAFYRRRGFYPRRRFAYRRRFSRRRVPSKRFVRQVRHVITKTAEKKYWDTSVTSTPVSASGTVLDLTPIPQGDTDQSRDGDQLTLRSIQGRFQFIAADATNICRIIIFQWFIDTTVSGVSPLVDQVIQTISNPLASYNHDGRYNFRILYDRTFSMDTTDDLTASGRIYIYKGLRRKVQYHGGVTGGKNKIYILYISDSGAITHPSLTYYTRVTFSDL